MKVRKKMKCGKMINFYRPYLVLILLTMPGIAVYGLARANCRISFAIQC